MPRVTACAWLLLKQCTHVSATSNPLTLLSSEPSLSVSLRMVNPIRPVETLIRGFRDDPLGTLRDYAVAPGPPNTRAVSPFSLTLHAQVGKRRGVVGAVHECSFSQGLATKDIFELGSGLAGGTPGIPREVVPMALSSRTISLQRYEIYTQTLEEVFGQPAFITLAGQLGPISLRMHWRRPTGSTIGLVLPRLQTSIQVYEFTGCYVTNLVKSASMEDPVVGANASLVWTDIRRLQ